MLNQVWPVMPVIRDLLLFRSLDRVNGGARPPYYVYRPQNPRHPRNCLRTFSGSVTGLSAPC